MVKDNNLCKDCKKRKINFKRSNRCCDSCLNKRIESQARYHQQHHESDLARMKSYGIRYKENKLSAGLCIACGVRKINRKRSIIYCSNCLEKVRTYRKTVYYPANKKKIQEGQKKSIKAKPELYKAAKRRNYESHKDDWFRWNREYRARKLNADGTFTRKEWSSLKLKYNGKCLWCGTDKRIEADHVVPLTKGGSNYISNVQPLCRICNSKKGTRIIDFRPFGSSILEWT